MPLIWGAEAVAARSNLSSDLSNRTRLCACNGVGCTMRRRGVPARQPVRCSRTVWQAGTMSAQGHPVFGALLRRHRQAVGLTQEELAERARLSTRAVLDLERGARLVHRRETVRLLAEALTLTAAERAAFEAAARRAPPSDPSPLPRAARLSATGRPDLPLVGRARELLLLEQHRAGDGPPVLLLAGEPGMGKSRLLQEAIRAEQRGETVLHGGCQRRGGQEPYAPLLQALERHVHSQPSARLRTALAGCAWLVRLLPELAIGPIEPLPAWRVAPEQERRLMEGAVLRYLANNAAPAGVLLVLDDLQWAGADALDLLVLLLQEADFPLRVVGAYRDTEVGRARSARPGAGRPGSAGPGPPAYAHAPGRGGGRPVARHAPGGYGGRPCGTRGPDCPTSRRRSLLRGELRPGAPAGRGNARRCRDSLGCGAGDPATPRGPAGGGAGGAGRGGGGWSGGRAVCRHSGGGCSGAGGA